MADTRLTGARLDHSLPTLQSTRVLFYDAQAGRLGGMPRSCRRISGNLRSFSRRRDLPAPILGEELVRAV